MESNVGINEELSKEFYELSKIRYLLKKELDSMNKNIINLDLKKKLIIEKPTIIEHLNDFKNHLGVQILKTLPHNGIEKSIGIIKNSDSFIDRKLDKISKSLNKNMEYIAIDIQKRYVMKNEKYFETHFNPIYQETFKDPNDKIVNLKSRYDVFDLDVSYDKIKYKIFSLNPSRKQNLSLNFKEIVDTITNSLIYSTEYEKNLILNKHLKSIDFRIEEIKSILLQNNDFENNDYCDITVLNKEEEFELSTHYSSDSLITKTLNGHAIIKHALENNLPILDDMFEEKLNFKILEVGSKEEVFEKINLVINSINDSSVNNNKFLDNLIVKEMESNYTDPFDNLI